MLSVDILESRDLLTTGLYEYPLPSTGGAAAPVPEFVTLGPSGHIWFTAPGSNSVGEFNPDTGSYSLVPTSSSNRGITIGPDGKIWVAGPIAQIDPSTKIITEYPVGNNRVQDLVTGPDGNLWFTSFGQNSPDAVGVFNPTTHAVTTFPLTAPMTQYNPTGMTLPQGIVAGPDGNLWFIEAYVAKLGMINPTTHAITEYSIPGGLVSPENIAVGPDGNLWFTENTTAYEHIGMFNIATHAFSDFPLNGYNSVNASIVAGPDGNVWFTGDDLVGMINPTTHATVLYPLPAGFTEAQGIVAGTHGDLWVATWNGDAGGQLDRIVINDPTGGGISLVAAGGGSGNPAGGGGGGGGTVPGGGGPIDSSPPQFLGVTRLYSGKGKRRKLIGVELRFSAAVDPAVSGDLSLYEVTQAGARKISPRKVIRVKSAVEPVSTRIDLTLGPYNTKKPLSLMVDGLSSPDGTPVSTINTNL